MGTHEASLSGRLLGITRGVTSLVMQWCFMQSHRCHHKNPPYPPYVSQTAIIMVVDGACGRCGRFSEASPNIAFYLCLKVVQIVE